MLRRDLFSFVFIAALLNAMIRPMREHIAEFGIWEGSINGFGISFIVWFAIFCSLDLLRKSSAKAFTHYDSIIAVVAMTMLVIPSAFVSWLALAFFSIYCAFFANKNAPLGRNASLIMTAVSMRIPISDICLKISADALLKFDALATLSFLKMLGIQASRQGNIIIGAEGHELLIMTGCASFTNISLALLLWFTILRANIKTWHSGLTLCVAPLIALVVGINVFRLSMMARSKELYFFYHDGLGADIISALILLTSIAMALLCLSFERRGRAYAL